MSGIILKELEIIFINIVLSVDNIGVIALTIKDLPESKAKQANKIGIFAAVVLRLLFVAIVGILYSIQWIPVNLIGGMILFYVTFSIIKDGSKNQTKKIKINNAVFLIVLADLSMSFDNVLIITSIAMGESKQFTDGQFWMIVLGVVLCIPIIFWGSNFVSELMQKHFLLTYCCAGILVFTAIKMIFQDELLQKIYPSLRVELAMPVGIICCALMIFYGALKKQRVRMQA